MESSKSPDPRPRILCLHGGGTTGEIFRMQLRAFVAPLSAFRLVFADAPFLCDAGPGVLPVYADCGPFRRWLRWMPTHSELDDEAACDEIWWQLNEAMEGDDRAGGSGEWTGLMGFSQGAKLAASLLYEAEWRAGKGIREGRPDWKFAVLLAGRSPLVSLRQDTNTVDGLQHAGAISEAQRDFKENRDEHMIRRPTIHVHGLQDPGLPLHRRLLEKFCFKGTTSLIEWDGGHRVPIKTADVKKVTEEIFKIALQTGVLGSVN